MKWLYPSMYEDERVLWEGWPSTGARAYVRDGSLVRTSAMVVIFVAVFTLPARGGIAIFGVMLLPLLLYAGGVMLAETRIRRRLRFFITNRRVVIVRRGRRDEVRSLDLRWLPPMKVTERPDGSGNLRFGLAQYGTGKGGRKFELNRSTPALSPVPHFIAIADVMGVYELIERTAADVPNLS